MLDYASSCCFFFFKQKTAYVMRISDSSSDVCSSDLPRLEHRVAVHQHERPVEMVARRPHAADAARDPPERVVDEIDRQRRRRGVEMRLHPPRAIADHHCRIRPPRPGHPPQLPIEEPPSIQAPQAFGPLARQPQTLLTVSGRHQSAKPTY